jgi:hypothetical protein
MDTNILIIALAGLTGLAMVSAAALRAWRGWLLLKAAELDKTVTPAAPANTVNTRIELADLKERLRKLEAIAAGVDL